MRPVALALALGSLLIASPTAVAGNGPSLSIFAPQGPATAWIRHDVGSGARKTVARFPSAEHVMSVAWSADRSRGLVWFEGDDRRQLFEATVANGKTRLLPTPTGGRLQDLGYDPAGRIVALVLDEPAVKEDRRGHFLLHAGKRYDVPQHQEGQPALAHAMALTGGTWKPVETAFTTTGWDYAMGVDALPMAKRLAPRTETLHERHPEGTEVEDAGVKARLTALAPKLVDPEGQWLRMTTAGGPVYLYEESIEFVWATNLLAWGDAKKPRRVPNLVLPPGENDTYRREAPELRLTAVSVKGHHLLVTDSGDGGHPRLFDVKAQRLAYSSDQDKAVLFWP